MDGQQRRRLDARSWREVMRRFEGADAPVSEFCMREGLSQSSFYRWRDRLGSGDEAAGVAARPGRRSELSLAPTLPPTAAGFIDLGRLAVPPRDAGATLELRLDLGEGVVLQIVRR